MRIRHYEEPRERPERPASTPATQHHEFSTRPLRAAGIKRHIQGWSYRGEKFVWLRLSFDGTLRGVSYQIRRAQIELCLEALQLARAGTTATVGSYADGDFTTEVRSGRHFEGGALSVQKFDSAGHDCGKAMALTGNELDALDAAIGWLAQ